MAQKARVPNPPKRSQGPQRRSTSADPRAADLQRRKLYLIAGSAAAVLVAVLAIVFLMGGGGSDNERPALEAAGFTLQSFPALPNKSDHSDVPTLQTKPKWNSSPPTSGPHYGVPAVWDFYDEEVPLVQTVHNLEHGGVVASYNNIPPASLAALQALLNTYPKDKYGEVKLLIRPYDKIPAGAITLTAWSWIDELTTYDEARVIRFLSAHLNQCCEDLP
jgi:hypothetical protein